MSDWIRDFKNAVTLGISVAFASRTTAVDGFGVDLGMGEEQAFAVIVSGTITDGTVTVTIQESLNDNTAGVEAADAYAAVNPAAAGSITPAQDNVVQVVNFLRRKRYVRASCTVANATTGGIYGVLFGTMKKQQ